VRRQTLREIYAPTIEQFATGRNSNKHSRVTVFGGADGRLIS
jgi:hypothetical protein